MDKDGDTRNKHGHTRPKPGKGSIPDDVVIALYCNKYGDVQIQEIITDEIRKKRVLECSYLPEPPTDIEVLVCTPAPPCFPCRGPTGAMCCCNCPP